MTVTRYFLDCEFIEDGSTIDLISIALACEDGRTYYAISKEFDAYKASPWVVTNVLTKISQEGPEKRKYRSLIAAEVRQFITQETRDEVELWADYGAYDHVALCQLYGTMMDLPPNIPMFTNDFQQLVSFTGVQPVETEWDNVHDALADALALKAQFEQVVADWEAAQ